MKLSILISKGRTLRKAIWAATEVSMKERICSAGKSLRVTTIAVEMVHLRRMKRFQYLPKKPVFVSPSKSVSFVPFLMFPL